MVCTALGAQSCPAAPLRFFVPMVALRWSEALGQQALSDNYSGAYTTVGTAQAARAIERKTPELWHHNACCQISTPAGRGRHDHANGAFRVCRTGLRYRTDTGRPNEKALQAIVF
jgi:hypothetical protein